MTLNDNSLLQYFIIPEKKKRQASTTHSKYKAIKNTYHSLVLLRLIMRLGTDLPQDILLLGIPPLLVMEKRKLENDVDLKINKLSLEPSVSK